MVGKFPFCNIVQQITGGGKEQNSRADIDMHYALLIILMISSDLFCMTMYPMMGYCVSNLSTYDRVSNDGRGKIIV